MDSERRDLPIFPVRFRDIIAKSIAFYKSAFFNYLWLATITYLPFLFLDWFSRLDLLDLVEFFHGNFLDTIVFLTLPTVFIYRKVFPFATVKLFVQRFFASAVIISFVQLGFFLFVMLFVDRISWGAIIIGMIPYIFLLFAGFFLVLENSSKLISVRFNLLNSIKLVRNRFFTIFMIYLNISLLLMVPLFLFSVWYLERHPQLADFSASLTDDPKANIVLTEELLYLLQNIMKEPSFRLGRIVVHILFRPVKSLFISFLFLGIIQQISPATIHRYLGFTSNGVAPESTAEDTADIIEDQGNSDENT